MDWRDKLALKSQRQADYAWTVLALILASAKDRGKITVNPCERGGRLYHGTRVDFVWTIDDEAAFLDHAPAHLHLPLLLGLWTGQRQGDLMRLAWSAYDGKHIRLRQSKTSARALQIPVGAPLKVALDEAAKNKRSPMILLNSYGRPWTQDGFRASWGKASDKAQIEDLTFNDLRGTAVTRLALVGCSEAEIATLTGHSLRDVRSILDAHYLTATRPSPRVQFASWKWATRTASLRSKLEQNLQNDRQNGLPSPTVKGGKSFRNQMAGGLGFEPRLTESESAVLPLNYPPAEPGAPAAEMTCRLSAGGP